MRILVIGGNGFIGSPLVRELQAAGHDVAVFHRASASPARSSGITQIQGDRNHLTEHIAQIERFSPEVIVDLILSSGEQAQQLMEAVSGITRRVVIISSMDVYRAWGVFKAIEPGPLEPLPLDESSPVRTVRRLYPPEALKTIQQTFGWLTEDYDKIAVEEAAFHADVPATVLRLPMIYGPGDPLHRFFPVLKRVADQRPCILQPEDIATWRAPRGYVDNVAHAIALAAISDQAAGRIYNVCQEPSLPELQWQTIIAESAGWSGRFVALPREKTPKHLLQPGNASQHIVATSRRIRTELGYREPVGLEEAVRRTVRWEQENLPASIDSQQFDYEAENAAIAELTLYSE